MEICKNCVNPYEMCIRDRYQQAKRSISVVDDYVNTKTLQLLSQNYLPGFRCLICAAAF